MFRSPLRELLHGSGIVKQTQSNPAEEVLQIQYALEAEDTTNRIGRGCALAQPLECLLTIKLNSSRNGQWIVRT